MIRASAAEHLVIRPSDHLTIRSSVILTQVHSLVEFGDLFLIDIRAYRERQLSGTGLEPLFPLWNLDTRDLARDMIAGGLRAKLTCVDPKRLAPSFAARDFDQRLLDELPAGVDPCGENGEFHSFVYAAPVFDRALAIRMGEIVERDGFVFADVVPEERGVGHNAVPAASPG